MRVTRYRPRQLSAPIEGSGVRPVFFFLLGGAVLLYIAARRRAQDLEASASAATGIDRSVGSAEENAIEIAEEIAKDIVSGIQSGAERVVVATSLYRAITAELPSLPERAKLMMIAQAITENGWNTGRAARNANNFWNITAGSAWKGDVYVAVNGDKSYTASWCKKLGRPMSYTDSKGRAYCKIDQKWRKYATVNDAVKDYWDFLGPNQNGGRYVAARNLLAAGDVGGFVRALRAAGYYDSPVEEYLSLMSGIVNSLPKYLAA